MNFVALKDGVAQAMGEGVFVVQQVDEHGVPQSVVLTAKDIRAMLGLG